MEETKSENKPKQMTIEEALAIKANPDCKQCYGRGYNGWVDKKYKNIKVCNEDAGPIIYKQYNPCDCIRKFEARQRRKAARIKEKLHERGALKDPTYIKKSIKDTVKIVMKRKKSNEICKRSRIQT